MSGKARQIFLLLYDFWLRCRWNLRKPEPAEGERQSDGRKPVLIVKTGGLGDFILWLDAAKRYRKWFDRQEYYLVLLANSRPAIDILRQLGYFDEYLFVDNCKVHQDLAYRKASLKAVRSRKFEIAVNADHVNNYRSNIMFIQMLGKETYKIGVKGAGTGIAERMKERGFQRLLPVVPELKRDIERYTVMLDELSEQQSPVRYPELPVLGENRMAELRQAYFVLSPTASDLRRAWPAERFVEIAQNVYRKKGWTAVIVGSKEDMEHNREIERHLEHSGVCVRNLTGALSILETAEVIRGAQIHIGNDSGNSHIANAVKTKHFVILGGGTFDKYFPYREEYQLPGVEQFCISRERQDCFGCGWNCNVNVTAGKFYPCMQEIRVEDVWRSVDAQI